MGTVHHLSIDDGRRSRDWREDPTDGLELPGWEEFTAARDRFFAGLRSAAEIYRNGDASVDALRPPEDATD